MDSGSFIWYQSSCVSALYTLKEFDLKLLIVGVYLGLMTYFIHGVLNNYLDTDKASIPFWGFIAILVAVDLYHNSSSASQSA